MKGILTFICLLWTSSSLFAQLSLSYYLPANTNYDSTIVTPREVLLHEVGEWHVSHDKLVQYMIRLSESSRRVSMLQYGSTYEGRPLLLLAISSPENMARLPQLQAEHQKLADPGQSDQLDTESMPAVVWLGYSVHGNEPSGSNASLVVAYHLAAASGPEIDSMLSNTVILIDPSINPDGFNRFASWVNSHRSFYSEGDEHTRELNEAWPRGRTNHYWFDLNRDWLPVQHPESKGRIDQFQAWRPNILTDHHEMGSDASFFFQPGIKQRNHPLIPKRTYELTAKIGNYHASALDQIGSFYYTQESFDDFYFGKGSTYPDVQGSIGILFEQASSRGHVHESENGILLFPFTIKNQVTASLSTLAAAQDMRVELLNHQRDFYKEAATEARAAAGEAYLLGGIKDKARVYHLLEILNRHQIKSYHLGKRVSQSGTTFTPEDAYIIPLNQPQHRLLKAIFDVRTSFEDSLFYDVSAWTMPYAFNIPYVTLKGKALDNSLLGEQFTPEDVPTGTVSGQSQLAYLIPWNGYYAPRALQTLFRLGVRVKVAQKAFTTSQGKRYAPGTLLISVPSQPLSSEELYNLMQALATENGLQIDAQETGLTPTGIDLGSNNFELLRNPKAFILADQGITGYDVGEVWHLFDQRMATPLTLMPFGEFMGADLDKYNTLIMVNGNYSRIQGAALEKLKDWVRKGGVIVAMKGASRWLSANGLSNAVLKNTKHDLSGWKSYTDYRNDRGAQVIGGAIFHAELDTRHPIGYGFERNEITLFKNGRIMFETPDNGYAYPLKYKPNPLAAGYISSENLEALGNTPAVIVTAQGRGRVITFSDNLNFRAFWYGTNKLFLNSVYFGHTIDSGTGR